MSNIEGHRKGRSRVFDLGPSTSQSIKMQREKKCGSPVFVYMSIGLGIRYIYKNLEKGRLSKNRSRGSTATWLGRSQRRVMQRRDNEYLQRRVEVAPFGETVDSAWSVRFTRQVVDFQLIQISIEVVDDRGKKRPPKFRSSRGLELGERNTGIR